jgi:hypothetical protein
MGIACSEGKSKTPRRVSLAAGASMGIFISLFLHLSLIDPASAQNSAPASKSRTDVNKLVRDVIQNEINSEVRDQSLWAYREIREEGGKKKLFDVVQTKDGEIQRLLAVNGQPLSTKQRQAEDQRVLNLVNRPHELQQLKKKQHDDAEQMRGLLKMFPDAFLFQEAGMQGDLMKINFSPNPKFHPNSRPAQVFHHLAGNLLVDPRQKRIVEINGKLISEVKFGGGLLGHLDQGGTFTVKQEDVGNSHWEMTYMDIRMDGKAFFFKTLAVRETEINSDFRPLPDNTTPQQAANLLLKAGDNTLKVSRATR